MRRFPRPPKPASDEPSDAATQDCSAELWNKVDRVGAVHYIPHMITTQQTETFADWFAGVTDPIAVKHIVRRIALLQAGHAGDSKPVGDKVAELRIDHGPGYRIYWTKRGQTVVILLAGGTKQSQQRDINRAKKLAAKLE